MKYNDCKMSCEVLNDVETYVISGFDLKRPENSVKEYDTKSILKYLSSKEYMSGYDYENELIFYPELHGMCDRHQSECKCLSEGSPYTLRKIQDYIERTFMPNKSHSILNYLHEYNFIEIYLDNLKLKDNLPEKIFSCENLKLLSLKGNNLEKLSVRIGALKKLESLYLNDNNLTDDSLPYTLIFCQQLRNLYLDNNRILKLPGFLLNMKYLWMLRRDGINVTSGITMNGIRNSESTNKIQPIEEFDSKSRYEVRSLQKLASHVVISSKLNPFLLKKPLQDTVLRYYWDCPMCDYCNATKFQTNGYYLNTYLYGYLGDYLSLFTSKTCCRACAERLSQSLNNDDRLAVLQRLTNMIINKRCSELNSQSIPPHEKSKPPKKFPSGLKSFFKLM